MKYLKPTTDIAFKKLFGSQERKDLTISFLNNILERQPGELITEVNIRDNANIPETNDKKISFVDVNCVDQTGKQYIIEMQVVNEFDFIPRSQYYASFFLSRQLEARGEYCKLVPVIFVGVVCYDLFGDDDYLSHHFITNSKTRKVKLRHLEFHFIETSKFNKDIDEVKTDTDKWVYLIKNAEKLEEIPKGMRDSKEMVEAFHVLEKTQWSSNELESYKAEEDEAGKARRQQEGAFVEGKAEGRTEGVEEGKLQAMTEIALKLVAQGLDDKIISAATSLSVEQIKQLRKK